MFFRRSLAASVLLLGLTLTGFGCKKIDYSQYNHTGWSNTEVKLPTIAVDTKPATTAAPKPIDRKPERQPEQEVLRLRDIMASFQKSQTYRADLTLGGPGGITGEIAYNREYGVFGKLTTANGFTSQMALQGDRVAVKSGTSTWREITGTDEGAQISSLFKSILSSGGSKGPLYPYINAHFVSLKDDPTRGCQMYTVSQFMGNMDSYQNVNFCVQNGLPTYFSIPSPDGLIEIKYHDVDKPVDVYFPLQGRGPSPSTDAQ